MHGLTFLFAVHIPDWNHIIMNTMRNVAIQVDVRTLGQDADAPFRSLAAGFVKWRYETISEVVCQLAPLIMA